MSYYGINRYVCSVLDEMRDCVKGFDAPEGSEKARSASKRHMKALIEEAQSLVNRMESGLGELKDLEKAIITKRDLTREVKILKREKEMLERENDAI